jgi:hypothetical protein
MAPFRSLERSSLAGATSQISERAVWPNRLFLLISKRIAGISSAPNLKPVCNFTRAK